MAVSGKVTGTASSIPGGLAAGAAVSLGVTAMLSAVTAWLVVSGRFAPDSVGYFVMVILLLSTASGAAMASGRIRRCRLQICLAAGGIYYGCLLAVTALFFGGIYNGMGVTALMVLCGCLATALLAPGSPARKKQRM